MDNKSEEELKKDTVQENTKNNKKSNKAKDGKFTKVKNVIEYIIIFAVILVNAILIFQSVQNPGKTPSLFGKKAFVIISGSMIPEIKIGDIVIINDTKEVAIRDIIAFRRNSTVIVHRIVNEMRVNGNIMYQTKGDNNEVEDIDLVEVSDIEGVLVGKIPYVGKVLMWVYNNLSIVVIILIGVLLVRYYFSSQRED